jgi:hypothetical protein
VSAKSARFTLISMDCMGTCFLCPCSAGAFSSQPPEPGPSSGDGYDRRYFRDMRYFNACSRFSQPTNVSPPIFAVFTSINATTSSIDQNRVSIAWRERYHGARISTRPSPRPLLNYRPERRTSTALCAGFFLMVGLPST